MRYAMGEGRLKPHRGPGYAFRPWGWGQGCRRGPPPQGSLPHVWCPKATRTSVGRSGFPGYRTWASAAEAPLHGAGVRRVRRSPGCGPHTRSLERSHPRSGRVVGRLQAGDILQSSVQTEIAGGPLIPELESAPAVGGSEGKSGQRQLCVTRGAWGYILAQESTSADISSGLVPLLPPVPTTACSWGANLGLYMHAPSSTFVE